MSLAPSELSPSRSICLPGFSCGERARALGAFAVGVDWLAAFFRRREFLPLDALRAARSFAKRQPRERDAGEDGKNQFDLAATNQHVRFRFRLPPDCGSREQSLTVLLPSFTGRNTPR